LATAGLLTFGSLALDRLDSAPTPQPPTFAETVTPRKAHGRFEAVTTNLGSRTEGARCTIVAIDVYGNTLGSDVIELRAMAPGESRAWHGRVRVDGRVERMRIDCR
jgi:hypothetical protein